MKLMLLAIIRNILGDKTRIYRSEDGKYFVQDDHKLYRMNYDRDFDPINFLNNATYEGEATLTSIQIIQLLLKMPISDVETPPKQPA